MLEFLFITGGALRMTHMHLPKGKSTPWLLGILATGLLVQFALLPFLSGNLREGLIMAAMVGMGLWILASGLLSMKSAPTWHSLRLLGFFVLVFSLLYQGVAPLSWQITSAVGILLALASFFLRPLWLRAFTFAWALLHAIVLELLYLLPLMGLKEVPFLDVLLMGSLFVTLGTSGLFALKYCCIFIATFLRNEKEYTDLFVTWLQEHFPMQQKWRRDGAILLLAMALLLGGMVGHIPQQTALYGALAMLMFPLGDPGR